MDSIEIILIISSLLLTIVGVIGSFLPAFPDVTLSFAALVIFKFSGYCTYSWWLVAISGLITAFAVGADYIIPMWGSKKMGGSKWGIAGCIVGLIVGSFFFPPIGTFVGCFIGAALFEMLFNKKKIKQAMKAGLGSFIGYISSMVLSLILTAIFTGILIYQCVPIATKF